MREVPTWAVVVSVVAFVVLMMYSANKLRQDNCREMFAIARSERDSLEVVMRSNIEGGDRCHIRAVR